MLERWIPFRRPPNRRPALLRVVGAEGAPISEVTVRGYYLPSGRPLEQRRRTAQGLCLFGWLPGDDRMCLEFEASQSYARVEVAAERPNAERVIEVVLEQPDSDAA